jgi:predicted translin family RNA/ssDNA-binding protein
MKQYFPLPVSDYLLGLSDVIGELMRFAISGITFKGGPKRAHDICTFVRRCKSGAVSFDRSILSTYTQSLQILRA